MRRKGKHAKPGGNGLVKIAAFFLGVLIIVQALMLNDAIRSKLSVVDFFEGQSIGIERGK